MATFCDFIRLVPHFLPAEHSEDEVEHEEGPEDDERDEEDPVELGAGGVVGLEVGTYVSYARSPLIIAKESPLRNRQKKSPPDNRQSRC